MGYIKFNLFPEDNVMIIRGIPTRDITHYIFMTTFNKELNTMEDIFNGREWSSIANDLDSGYDESSTRLTCISEIQSKKLINKGYIETPNGTFSKTIRKKVVKTTQYLKHLPR